MTRNCIDCGHREQTTRHGLCDPCRRKWRERSGRVTTEDEEEGGQVTLSDF